MPMVFHPSATPGPPRRSAPISPETRPTPRPSTALRASATMTLPEPPSAGDSSFRVGCTSDPPTSELVELSTIVPPVSKLRFSRDHS
ncbi:proline-rich receptor-like protein kinase PERK8 [Iris pallida]|uniref:Proline-rich receptor-like protein kinase PERK8 n=1 Tax=Iris pallida TaxID=29817 RepID=A0AAX6HTD2_IRIPA|nr:proline-rich receptor-like protein kinase PERK8 [Iris pallida]